MEIHSEWTYTSPARSQILHLTGVLLCARTEAKALILRFNDEEKTMLEMADTQAEIILSQEEKDMLLGSVKNPRENMDSQYFKDKALLMEAKEKGDVLDAEAEAFLADVDCTAPYDQPQALTTTNMFQANHEDAYDSDVDEGPNAAVAFMANLSSTSATNNPVNEEEHLDSDAETEIDDNTIPYHQYLLDTEAQNVLILNGHAKVNQEKCLEIETLKNELLQCKQEICRLDTQKVKLDLENKVRQEQALVIQRNKRNAELVQENDLLKSTLSGNEKSIAFLQSEKEKILSEKKELADSYLDEIVCLKNANKVARDICYEQQLVPFYDHFKKHIESANETIFKEVKEYEQIFDDLDAEYERYICSIVLTSDIVMPPSSNCICKDLRSACDREHTKVLELEAERFKDNKRMGIESEKLKKTASRNDNGEENYQELDAQINIMKVLNVGSTEGSCDQQALETDRIQLKDTITSLRIQLDGLKVENVSLKRRYDELSKANTHSRTVYTEKINALTTENAKLKTELSGKRQSKGRPVADSIAERLTRQRYKFEDRLHIILSGIQKRPSTECRLKVSDARHAHILTHISEEIKKVYIQSFRTISENQCLLQMLNVMEIRRRYIIKAFQIPTDMSM
ncbi:hypothetical protein Tco_0413751 [Tanacetum coccineum]